jgi:hypothetical protein
VQRGNTRAYPHTYTPLFTSKNARVLAVVLAVVLACDRPI